MTRPCSSEQMCTMQELEPVRHARNSVHKLLSACQHIMPLCIYKLHGLCGLRTSCSPRIREYCVGLSSTTYCKASCSVATQLHSKKIKVGTINGNFYKVFKLDMDRSTVQPTLVFVSVREILHFLAACRGFIHLVSPVDDP